MKEELGLYQKLERKAYLDIEREKHINDPEKYRQFSKECEKIDDEIRDEMMLMDPVEIFEKIKDCGKYLIKTPLEQLNRERDRYSAIIREAQDRHLREVFKMHDKLAEYEQNNSRLQNRIEFYSSKISEMNNILKRLQEKTKEKS